MTNPAYEAANSDERLIAEMKAAAEKATAGEWWSDVVECDGTYGNGDECAEGFHSYAVYDSNNQTLLDMTNSTAACIQVDCDDESHYAWDEVAERNAEFIVLARPENVMKLIAALEQAHLRNGQLKAERDALRESGLNGQANTRAAADIYFQLIEECDIQPGGSLVQHIDGMRDRIAELEAAPNGMMQLSNDEIFRDANRYRFLRDEDSWGEDSDSWDFDTRTGLISWEALADARLGDFDAAIDARMAASDIPATSPLCVKSSDAMREAAPLCVKLPDSSSKAFWSGIGKTEKFHPETYKRWVKESIERAGDIAGIKVEVK